MKREWWKERNLTVKRRFICNIINQQYSHGTTIISWEVGSRKNLSMMIINMQIHMWLMKRSLYNCRSRGPIQKYTSCLDPKYYPNPNSRTLCKVQSIRSHWFMLKCKRGMQANRSTSVSSTCLSYLNIKNIEI